MTAAAIAMLIVALAVVPGGLIASTIFLARRPERAEYPPLPPDRGWSGGGGRGVDGCG